jgi:Asp-tRNA(Asn)/Glu-tRNA(Gln) amidotransferase A subunit family amidase
MPDHQALDLLRVTLTEVLAALQEGRTTSEELVLAYAMRVDANNEKGLGLHAVLEMAPMDKGKIHYIFGVDGISQFQFNN